MAITELELTYDELPYPSYTFPKTGPDWLATMAIIHGMNPAKPENCRMLELGCADGTNLLSMAYRMPLSSFTGIDLAKGQIDSANQAAKQIGVTNVTFLQADVTKLDMKQLGEFDYIAAHGLYSWASEPVRESILDIYSSCLAQQGVGYISYNVFPGGHIRRMVWEIMGYYAGSETDPRKKVEKAKAIIGFLSDAAEKDSSYKHVLQKELSTLLEREDENIFHDDLEIFNQPFYFHEFVNQITAKGLQYLSDADPDWRSENSLSDEVRNSLNAIAGNDRIQREQYLDFIRCQRFKSTLFCRNGIEIIPEPSPAFLDRLMLASRLAPVSENVDITGTSVVKFKGPENETIELNHPLTKSVLIHLNTVWPRAIPFVELLETCAGMLKTSRDQIDNIDVDLTRKYLIDMFKAELVELHSFQAPFVSEISGRPKASDFARLQIDRNCKVATTMTGVNVEMNNAALRVLISLLDGTRNRDALIKGMVKRIKVPSDEQESLRKQLPGMIENNLRKMAEIGLLVA